MQRVCPLGTVFGWTVLLSLAVSRAEPPAEKPAPADATKAVKQPVDTDPDQWDDFQHDVEAITDGGLAIDAIEMPAYWQVIHWVQRQSIAEMEKRAVTKVEYTRFVLHPEKYRGKLVRMELNYRRTMSDELADPSVVKPAAAVKFVEAWGFTRESRTWPYATVLIDCPKEFPIDPNVNERAVFVGYFFKIQGYHSAAQKPDDPPLKAPLLIGRIQWYPADLPEGGPPQPQSAPQRTSSLTPANDLEMNSRPATQDRYDAELHTPIVGMAMPAEVVAGRNFVVTLLIDRAGDVTLAATKPAVSDARPLIVAEAARMRGLLNLKKDEQIPVAVVIFADTHTTYKPLISVVDACQRNGFRRVVFRDKTHPANMEQE